MAGSCAIVMTEPTSYEVSYAINPWMRPNHWNIARERQKNLAVLRWRQLYNNLIKFGVQIHLVRSVEGLPDLVFPANAAVVLDRKVLLSHFAYPQRQREESVFRSYFRSLLRRQVISSIEELPAGVYQEGAGDCLWDGHRNLFWCGYGQRSVLRASYEISRFFQCRVEPLELVDPRFYHLDVAMAVLEKGEVLYYPAAFSKRSLQRIREIVAPELRIEVSRSEATRFNLNVISMPGVIFMTPASQSLRGQLMERGYYLCEQDLAPFLLAGGAAACLTLRLDFSRAQSQHQEVCHERHC